MVKWFRKLFRARPSAAKAVPKADGNLAQASDSDRRQWPRVQLQLEVRMRFASTEAMIGCETFDISPGGAFISLDSPRDEGTHVRLTIAIADRTLVLAGVVVRASRGDDGPKGMGIMFTEISAADGEFLARLCDTE